MKKISPTTLLKYRLPVESDKIDNKFCKCYAHFIFGYQAIIKPFHLTMKNRQFYRYSKNVYIIDKPL